MIIIANPYHSWSAIESIIPMLLCYNCIGPDHILFCPRIICSITKWPGQRPQIAATRYTAECPRNPRKALPKGKATTKATRHWSHLPALPHPCQLFEYGRQLPCTVIVPALKIHTSTQRWQSDLCQVFWFQAKANSTRSSVSWLDMNLTHLGAIRTRPTRWSNHLHNDLLRHFMTSSRPPI